MGSSRNSGQQSVPYVDPHTLQGSARCKYCKRSRHARRAASETATGGLVDRSDSIAIVSGSPFIERVGERPHWSGSPSHPVACCTRSCATAHHLWCWTNEKNLQWGPPLFMNPKVGRQACDMQIHNSSANLSLLSRRSLVAELLQHAFDTARSGPLFFSARLLADRSRRTAPAVGVV